ncbi:MAG: transglutaminase-like domain-containing protein [Chiayiivirga sp.]|uniref:transglutaminase-like domain-containing protein n=1 Tax=Chiayiivirga sp. TaxID=2041042 RepID=UPI0025B840A8|nr:transglutaminase-like domain-containing protein [Chiayiivirga sp.]MCI1730444.1 transglutaminase-like domain-containing protein [Chiayiivirga sp.]
MRTGLAWLGLWFAALAVAAPQAPEETWYSVHLDGRKIGHMRSVRALEADGRVRHEQALVLTVERSGQVLRIATDERSWETAAGAPLAFETRVDMAGSASRTYGSLEPDGRLQIRSESQGQAQQHSMVWPEGALLPEGQRLAGERAGFAPGTRYRVLAFDTSSLQAMGIRTRVKAMEEVEIHGRREHLLALDQVLDIGGVPTETRAWVEPDTHDLRRLRMPAIGLTLEMLACDQACALAPVQPTDVFASTLVASPRALGPRHLRHALRYNLRLRRGEGASLAQVPGQSLQALATGREYALTVDPRGDDDAPPVPADLAPNRWLQSDDEEVVALGRRATHDVQGKVAQAKRLENFVRSYITTKSLRVGYASAREVVRGREGDCTEHAVLLAALMRANGIPARVATGIAYTPSFGGKQQVFVPHAWVMAWVGKEWRGYDAALAGFDAGHIAFTLGDGDPFRFYGGIELLGGLEMLSVERARRDEPAEVAQ